MSTPTPIQKAEADVAAVKAWYKQYPFYAGLIGGAVAHFLAAHFLHIP
jgi:hypothetical protein